VTADVLITGASSGVGEALARHYVRAGARVWGVARRGPLLEALGSALPAGRFIGSPCDVTSPGDVDAVVAAMDRERFVPDIAVLNAGVNLPDLEPTFRVADCEHVFRVNLFGALVWVDRLLPRLLARGRGHFAAISSVSAFRPTSQSVGYAASKAALNMAFESFRLRYGDGPLRFTTVLLGPVDTAMWPGGPFPFLLSAEDAARRIARAIDRGKTVYDCPAPMVWLARLSRLVPATVFKRLERRFRAARPGPVPP
jgi:NAD(P)-dependent dehydrogenase (short-subunit alcohol dehydrogenase family)